MKFLFAVAFIVFGYAPNLWAQPKTETKIAFLADVHLQDLYGTLQETDFKGIVNPKNGKHTLLRTMDAQLHSTRIFNENYFAFIAALEDIAKRNIHIVALPGDYSDDGQPIHIRGLQKLLDEYERKYNIQFFITTGNHDPVGPFAQPAGKDDFLGEGGKRQPIFSTAGIYKANTKGENPLVISPDISKMGYEGITEHLHNFGFFPKKEYKYWATPFSSYNSENYSLEKAIKESALAKRVYDVAPGYTVPDVSYLVEPVDGLWLLAIDGNVYLPKANANAANPKAYRGADLGYNNVLTNKKHLINWVQKVAADAKRLGKTLIAFSHYPMVEFNDDASPQIEALMGKGKWQLDRVPVEDVAQTFADAGLQIHFGGHMHINDTGIRTTIKGNTLVNIQTPSLAAYIPGYKLLTVKPNNIFEIETITIDNVPDFDNLFPLYEEEYTYLKSVNAKDIWNHDILKTKSYHEFTDFHLKELVRLRFLPDDWPTAFKDFIFNVSGYDLLVLANTENNITAKELLSSKNSGLWKSTEAKAQKQLTDFNLKAKDFKNWTGLDMLIDLYRIRSADVLALQDITPKRIKEYQLLSKYFKPTIDQNNNDSLKKSVGLFFSILDKFLNGAPADHFSIDLNNGKIKEIK
ncbi:metallophosphoesterase [Flavobacterium sp. Sd200]|uniref:metallophosphoesterase family protein n=1 Tax=Flavobacterium sp. Sd200 TaxID=2692211 RepID=UPI00136BAB48|nr:metallophosphoesterase [Flavobacterium sp. Sd200]MXN92413.1 metallophosphoesterase [Flavobacterium sp. Sd200]